MKQIAIKDLFSNVRIVLIVSGILLLFSLNYHLNLSSGLRFAEGLSADKTMKYMNKETRKDYVDSYSCWTPESMFEVMVLPKKCNKQKRDALIDLKVGEGAIATRVCGIPAYRIPGDGGEVFGGGTYYVLTNNLAYIISFHKNIGQQKEEEILKGVTISGGDFGFRYYVGAGFYIILIVFLLSLAVFIVLFVMEKKQIKDTSKVEEAPHS